MTRPHEQALLFLRKAEADIAAARGSLYVFDKRAAKTPAEEVTLPEPEGITVEIQPRFSQYCRIVNRCYGDVPEGQPYRIEGARK